MTNRECRNTRREIDELELGHRPSAQAAAHMAACTACRQFQAECSSLRELVGSLEPVVAPPDFDIRLRARIAAEKYDKRRQPFFARLISTPALAAAALFVIVAGSIFWISRRPVAPVGAPSNPQTARNSPEPKAPPTIDQSNSSVVTPPSNDGPDVATTTPNKTVHRNRGSRAVTAEDSLARGADSIRQTADLDEAYVPNRPVEFALQDERGKTRKISLPAVSFGAQNLVEKPENKPTNVVYSASSRVW
jgi:hypothetical protein